MALVSISSRFFLKVVVLVLSLATMSAAQIKPIDQMSTTELLELAEKLPLDQREIVLQEFSKAEQIARDIVERGRLQLNAATMQAMEENRRVAAQRVLSQLNAHETEIVAEVQNTVIQHIFAARLVPNAIEGGALALFNDTSFCEVKRRFSNPIAQALCDMKRPDATAHLSPILDPLIAYQCQLPPAFVSPNVRRLCNRSPQLKGKAYTDPRSNKTYALLEDLFRNDYEQRRAETMSRNAEKKEIQATRLKKTTCGRTYVRAQLYGLFDLTRDSDLSHLSGIQQNLVKRMSACKRRFGVEDSQLYRTTDRAFLASPSVLKKDEILRYCEQFAPSYSRLGAKISDHKMRWKLYSPHESAFLTTVQYCYQVVRTAKR